MNDFYYFCNGTKTEFLRIYRSEGLIPNSSLKHFVKYDGAVKPTSYAISEMVFPLV